MAAWCRLAAAGGMAGVLGDGGMLSMSRGPWTALVPSTFPSPPHAPLQPTTNPQTTLLYHACTDHLGHSRAGALPHPHLQLLQGGTGNHLWWVERHAWACAPWARAKHGCSPFAWVSKAQFTRSNMKQASNVAAVLHLQPHHVKPHMTCTRPSHPLTLPLQCMTSHGERRLRTWRGCG